MRSQTIIWTPLPAGSPEDDIDHVLLRLSVHVAPRLRTDEGLPVPTLEQFPDFADWPGTLRGISWTVNVAGTPLPGTVVSPLPGRELWDALFPPTTFVRPHVQPAFHDRKVRSYPVRNVTGFLLDLYRDIAVGNPTDHPGYGRLTGPDAFGGITFPENRSEQTVEQELEDTLDREQAIPPGPRDPLKDFLQLRRFLAPRGRSVVDLAEPDFDFHDVLTLVLDHPALLRLLGLVIDLDFPIADLGDVGPSTVEVRPQWTPALDTGLGSTTDVTPATRCIIHPPMFTAAPRADAPELADGHLALGDADRYEIVQIDPDGGAIKALDFAANLTGSREHPWDDQPQAYALPSLRSAGLSVARVGQASRFVSAMGRAKQIDDGVEGGGGAELDAEDVTRGYHVDVWDSASQHWHPLHAREGRYTFVGTGQELVLRDEGVLTTAPTSAADGSSRDLYLQESLFQWMGWSLAAPRPGTAIAPDDQVSQRPDNPAATKYPLEIRFRPVPGTLPRLRFGVTYRIRMRAADLAGGSPPFIDDDPAANPSVVSAPVGYARYEPVGSPVVALRQPLARGEVVDQLVIRSNYDTPVKRDAQRHLLPPQTTQLMAEQHGRLDTPAAPRVPSVVDRAAWAQIAERERQTLATSPQATADPDNPNAQPYFDVDALVLPYLPDPLARGAAFVGLEFPEGVLKVSFDPEPGRPWFEQRTMRIVLNEGPTGWTFDSTANLLTVSLPKAETVTLRMSTYVGAADLATLGIWQLIEEAKPANLAALRQTAVNGQHWMLTPYRVLTLVHAVRQPLATPEFLALPVSRTPGQTFVTYNGIMSFHVNSTGRLDVLAGWQDQVDGGPGTPDPSARPKAVTAFDVPVPKPAKVPQPQTPFTARHEFGDTKHRNVTYTAVATSRFTRHFATTNMVKLADTTPVPLDSGGIVPDSVEVSDGNGEYAEGRDFIVDYVAGDIRRTDPSGIPDGGTVQVAFLPSPVTRTTDAPQVRDVPSSAHPAAPKVIDVIPTFRWTEQRTATQVTSTRKGGGLRVYLDRPWWSSGEGELLGVVIERNPTATKSDSVRNRLRALVTQWAADPVYQTSTTPPPNPTTGAFPLAVRIGTDLTLEGAPEHVDVAGHAVAFDPDRKLWYCDIELNLGSVYMPFVRLAIVRYQPSSLPGLHLSRVVTADFTQVAPERVATVVRNAATPTVVSVSVSGRTYLATSAGPGPASVRVSPEIRDPNVPGDLGWVPAPAVAPVTLNAKPSGDDQVWSGNVTLPSQPQPGQQRLVLEEFERVSASANGDGVGTASRVVYTDVITL
jgi:hypothetical protein